MTKNIQRVLHLLSGIKGYEWTGKHSAIRTTKIKDDCLSGLCPLNAICHYWFNKDLSNVAYSEFKNILGLDKEELTTLLDAADIAYFMYVSPETFALRQKLLDILHPIS